jgi:hypothetical protein
MAVTCAGQLLTLLGVPQHELLGLLLLLLLLFVICTTLIFGSERQIRRR